MAGVVSVVVGALDRDSNDSCSDANGSAGMPLLETVEAMVPLHGRYCEVD